MMTAANIFTIGQNRPLLIQGVQKQKLLLTGNWALTMWVRQSRSVNCDWLIVLSLSTFFFFFYRQINCAYPGSFLTTSVGFSIERIDVYFPEYSLTNRNCFILYNRCFSLHFLPFLLSIFLQLVLHLSTSAGLFPVNGVITVTGLNLILCDLRSYNLVAHHEH